MPTAECQCPCGGNSECRLATQRLQSELNGLPGGAPPVCGYRRGTQMSGILSVSKWRHHLKPPGWRSVNQAGATGAKGRHAFVGCGERRNYRFVFGLFFTTQLSMQSRPDCLRRCRPQVNSFLENLCGNVNI